MGLKRFFWLVTLLLALSTAVFLSAQQAQAAITFEAKVNLFTADEWTALETNSSKLAETLLIRLNSQRNQVGEAGAGLARRVTGGATNDLHDLGQAGPIADRQRVFAPNPVKTFFRHA